MTNVKLTINPALKFPGIVIPAWIAGIQSPWTDLSIPSMALDARFPAGMTVLNKSDKELRAGLIKCWA